MTPISLLPKVNLIKLQKQIKNFFLFHDIVLYLNLM